MKKNKRSVYIVRSYDGKIKKEYCNYGSAYNYCIKLISREIWCGLYTLLEDEDGHLEYKMLFGC